jgi:hypothetical protein
MSRKAQMIIAIVICAVVWIAGVYYLYDSYKTGDVRVSGNIVTVAREMDVDRNGKVLGEKNFVEAKSAPLALLSLACGVVGLIFIVRGFTGPPQHSVKN